MSVLPDVLARDTIIECAFEMRFTAAHPSVAELLPGLVFGKLPGRFKTVASLPLGQVPRQFRDQNPQLKYAPTHFLEGSQLRMLIGPNVVAVSFPKPYQGWKKVQPIVVECITAVFGSNLITTPERFGLKYVNVLQHGRDEYDLSQTTLRLGLGDFQIHPKGTYVRTEIERNGCLNVVEIISGGKLALFPGLPELTGVVVTVDAVHDAPSDFKPDALPQLLETLHTTEKEIYFGLLTTATLEKLGPRYSTTH